ncbi:MAG: amidohydrolase family protein [Bacteroidota bacterium]
MEAHILTAFDRPLIIADPLVITCDASEHSGRMSLLVREGRIAEISADAQALRDGSPDADVLDARSCLVVPAFVNAHFHPESIFFEDIARVKPYALWKLDKGYQQRMDRLADPAFAPGLKTAYSLGALHHIASGVLTVGQMAPPVAAEEMLALTEHERQLHVLSRTVLRTWEQIARGKEFKSRKVHLAVSIGGDAEYTVYSLDNLARTARELGVPISVHLGELKEEAEILRRNFKKGLLAVLRDARVLTPSTQIIHLNHGSAEDLAILAENHATLTICPGSAAAKKTGYPLLRSLERHRIPLCLGTDWGSTDILAEMKFVAALPLLFSNLPEFAPLDILKMATINGARALGIGEENGSIERGKRADLVLFKVRPIHLEHLSDAFHAADLARLILSRLNSADISRVIAGGKIVYQDGQYPDIDEASTVTQFREFQASLPGGYSDTDIPGHRGKIIPFMASPSSRAAGTEGFEEGFTVHREPAQAGPAAVQATPDQPAQPVAPPPEKRVRQERDVRKPELSKNVRLEFGDDDEPGRPKGE